jgi:Ni/Co efflux regulator RcnB
VNRFVKVALAVSLLGSTAAIAQPGRYDQGGPDRYEGYRSNPAVRMGAPRFSRGDRVPQQYRGDRRYVVNDWQQRHLRKPPRGYHWVRDDGDNSFLAAVTTGIILDLLMNSGR